MGGRSSGESFGSSNTEMEERRGESDCIGHMTVLQLIISEQLNNLYRQLDAISSQQSSARANPSDPERCTSRPGHVAPSHRRFTMPPALMRDGKKSKRTGEGWMWASGEVGSWPEPGLSGSGDGLDQNEVGTLEELAGHEVWREETRDLERVLEGIQNEV